MLCKDLVFFYRQLQNRQLAPILTKKNQKKNQRMDDFLGRIWEEQDRFGFFLYEYKHKIANYRTLGFLSINKIIDYRLLQISLVSLVYGPGIIYHPCMDLSFPIFQQDPLRPV